MVFDFQSSRKIINKDLVGNKFFNLFLLKNEMNLNVPEAFCITSADIDQKEILARITPPKKYAIRSSSNSEDMSNQSAAGMFKSYLNVQGSDQILQKIRECFNSINSDEAQAYLKSKNTDLTKAKVSVIVQEMVLAEKAGVLFTINPVNGAREVVVEYMQGIAEDLMDGNVIPERAVFSNPVESKGTFLNDLVITGKKIEEYFKKPQDVEWAFKDEQFFLLQTRPITTQVDQKRDLSRVWTRANVGEILPRPLTPLSWDVFKKVLFSSYRFGFYGIHDWILTNIIHLIPREFPSIISPQKFDEIAYLNLDTVRVAFSFEPWVSEEILNIGLGFSFNDGEISKNLKLTTRLVKAIKTTVFYIERLFPFLSMEKRVLRILQKKLLKMGDVTFDEIVKRVSLIFGWHIAVTARSFSYLGYLSKKAGKNNRKEKISELLLKQDTTDFVLELEKLQQTILDYPKLKEKIIGNDINRLHQWEGCDTFKAQFDVFLNTFGHRSDNEFELFQKDWHENPEQLKDALIREKQNLKGKESDLKKEDHKVVNSFKLREDLKNLLILEYRKIRRHFLKQAHIYVQDKKLENAEDIFFFTYAELSELEKKSQKEDYPEIKDRKKQFLQSENTNIPFSFSTDENGNVIKALAKTKDALTGVGCSKGVISGRAVHVFSLKDGSKLEKGDIMITSATDPGWTPLFAKVAGVVTEIGGMLSHTATIAREFNIPMITGIENLATGIPNGKTIEMDGTSGTIKIMEDA